jgi:hypothetical protein
MNLRKNLSELKEAATSSYLKETHDADIMGGTVFP